MFETDIPSYFLREKRTKRLFGGSLKMMGEVGDAVQCSSGEL